MSTAALVASCDFNAKRFRAQVDAGAYALVMAVDGGYAHLQAVGCTPDLVVGDFDSLGYVPDCEGVEVHPTHKDESDLELALMRVADEGFRSVEVYGALGGRLDHTIASLQIGVRFAQAGIRVTLVGADVAVRILAGPGRFELPLRECGTVSVFSATDESLGVSEWGMEYPLEGARLTNNTPRGLSNELMGLPAGVSLEQGVLYVFYPLEMCQSSDD